MDLEECPLSKEELLKLVEEEAALRVSAGFLEQVGKEESFCKPWRWNKRKERARQKEVTDYEDNNIHQHYGKR